MTNHTMKRENAPKIEEKKLPGPSPEGLKVIVQKPAVPKIKIISQAELALVATVLDFTSDD
jgi:hypothetical protein